MADESKITEGKIRVNYPCFAMIKLNSMCHGTRRGPWRSQEYWHQIFFGRHRYRVKISQLDTAKK